MNREENEINHNKCVYTEIDSRAKQGLGYSLTPELTRKLIEGKLARMQELSQQRLKVTDLDFA